jgi:succinate dehydrogenase/fumarate reductase-like Fe-S protein
MAENGATPKEDLIPIYIMNKQYEVPASLTIMKALEYAGYKLIRGVGCRGGFCGACATVFRTADDYRLKIGLACSTMVEPNMYLAQIPFFPAPRGVYHLEDLKPDMSALLKTYPEVLRCLSCGTCTKVCPQDIDVKDYMADAMKGNITALADKSFDCIMCGLCSSRCPAEEKQYQIAILARRLYAKYLAPAAEHLHKRVAEIAQGQCDEELAKVKALTGDELRKVYYARDIEPE